MPTYKIIDCDAFHFNQPGDLVKLVRTHGTDADLMTIQELGITSIIYWDGGGGVDYRIL